MSLKVIFDFDTFIYRCGFAVEKKDEEGITHVEPLENAYHTFNSAVTKVLERYQTGDYEGYLSEGPGFRAGISVTRVYKGNRDTKHKPFHYEALRTYAEERFGARRVKQIEADDACAIAFTACGESGILCSNDKDLLQLPGRHYNWVKQQERIINAKEATLNFYKQIITGDPTDNIEGIPGKGPKAASILDESKSSEEAERTTWKLYQEAFNERAWEKFLEMGRLVYILRHDHEVGKLWEPKYVTPPR